MNCPELVDLNLNLCTNLHPGLMFICALFEYLESRNSGCAQQVFMRTRLVLTSLCNSVPERLLIQCPKLKDVHVKGCRDMLIGAVRNQVLNEFAAIEPQLPYKRLADGSKRVHVPHFMIEQVCKNPSGLCSDQTKPSVRLSSHLTSAIGSSTVCSWRSRRNWAGHGRASAPFTPIGDRRWRRRPCC